MRRALRALVLFMGRAPVDLDRADGVILPPLDPFVEHPANCKCYFHR